MSAEVAGSRPPPTGVVPHLVRPEPAAASAWAAAPAAAGERVEGDTVELDERLARGFAAGDRACLEEAYRRWAPLVHALAHHELRRTADAEDVTQQVFVSAWRSRAAFSPERGSLAGWIVGITRHRILDHQRRQQRQLRLATTLESEAATGPGARGGAPDRELERLVLASEVLQLSDPRGTILRMAFWEGYTYSQIADALDLPLGTVKSHVRRALLHLRDRLKETASWTT